MIDQGAQLIFVTSDDMKDGAAARRRGAPRRPHDLVVGRQRLGGGQGLPARPGQPRQHHGQDGVRQDDRRLRAALTTQTGSIGYLGPLINDETRRLVNSAYLGARYCWENYRGEDPADLTFAVNWIGFWFNIPGVTLDPDPGRQRLHRRRRRRRHLAASTRPRRSPWPGSAPPPARPSGPSPTTIDGACDERPGGLPGRALLQLGPGLPRHRPESSSTARSRPPSSGCGPDWADINNPETTAVGFVTGPAVDAGEPGAASTSSSPAWPTARSTCGPARSTTRTARPSWPTARPPPTSRSGTRSSCSRASTRRGRAGRLGDSPDPARAAPRPTGRPPRPPRRRRPGGR